MRCLLQVNCQVQTRIGKFVARLVAFGCIAAGAPASAATALEDAAKAPSLARYKSALADYRRFADQPVGDWRDANAVVGQIGGWRAYARESQGGASAATSGDAGPRDTPNGSAHDAHRH